VSDKRKREARAIMAETGMNYTAALREADRRHSAQQDLASSSLPDVAVPDAAGRFLANLLAPSAEPGPPYVHTLEGPIPPMPDYKPYRIEGGEHMGGDD
jgi:hypothetical protein